MITLSAMILNALGFSGRALYLTPRFYRNRPVEVLIGENGTAAQLNDASLGTALDAFSETGVGAGGIRASGERGAAGISGSPEARSLRILSRRRRSRICARGCCDR
jgi:hypothetical protein